MDFMKEAIAESAKKISKPVTAAPLVQLSSKTVKSSAAAITKSLKIMTLRATAKCKQSAMRASTLAHMTYLAANSIRPQSRAPCACPPSFGRILRLSTTATVLKTQQILASAMILFTNSSNRAAKTSLP